MVLGRSQNLTTHRYIVDALPGTLRPEDLVMKTLLLTAAAALFGIESVPVACYPASAAGVVFLFELAGWLAEVVAESVWRKGPG
jgi:hypothetical protein